MTDLHAATYKTEPLAHQRAVLEQSCDRLNFALLMEQGTGKTKVAIDTIAHLYLSGEIDAALIIAPSGVDFNWVENELPKHLSDNIVIHKYQYLSHKAKTKAATFQRKWMLEITPNSPKLRIVTMIPEALLTDIGRGFAEQLLTKFKTILVIDESGKIIKNHKAQRTKILIKLGKLAKYRRILTGTPITKSPLDLYAQFQFLDPSILGFNNFFSFRNYFATTEIGFGGARNFIKVNGYKNLDKLEELVRHHSFRVLKKDCLDLPPKIYEKVYYTLSAEQQKLYTDLLNDDAAFPGLPHSEADLFTLLEEAKDIVLADNILKKLLRLQQIVNGYVVCESGNTKTLFDDLSKNPRIALIDNILEDAGEKIIIWARFRQEINMLLDYYGAQAVGYHGLLTESDRAHNMWEFRHNPKLRLFIANQSMGYGWTMNEATSVIYFSNDFNLEHRLQSEDRCHRAGQKNQVTYFDLIAQNTIDQHILKNLQKKIGYSQLLDNLNKRGD